MTLQTARKELLQKLEGLPLEALVEIAKYVDYWQFKHAEHSPVVKQSRRKHKHAAAGIWKDRTDIKDSAEYSLKLRQMIETRQDGKLPR